MAAPVFDRELSLYWPIIVPPARIGGSLGFLYFSAAGHVDGVHVPICVVLIVPKGAHHEVYANGTRARVVGTPRLIRNCLHLVAPRVTPLASPDTPANERTTNLLWAALISAGVVSTTRLAVVQPQLSFHSVAVADDTIRKGALARIRCVVDAEENSEVVMTGVVAGFSPSSLSVTVVDVQSSLPRSAADAYPTLWAPSFEDVVIRGAVNGLALDDDGTLPDLGLPRVTLCRAPPAVRRAPTPPQFILDNPDCKFHSFTQITMNGVDLQNLDFSTLELSRGWGYM
ncbi:hypothetical protein AURDEDRAFT_124820 [Auricularia subglabra TFB-10046 SS5]|nr:hypothetical protein AURDEDRAFT_124820 [Auricularia subglabra TFB-10046 SS5]